MNSGRNRNYYYDDYVVFKRQAPSRTNRMDINSNIARRNINRNDNRQNQIYLSNRNQAINRPVRRNNDFYQPLRRINNQRNNFREERRIRNRVQPLPQPQRNNQVRSRRRGQENQQRDPRDKGGVYRGMRRLGARRNNQRERLPIQRNNQSQPTRTKNQRLPLGKIDVKNLSADTINEDLINVFGAYGRLKRCAVFFKDGKSTQEGVVQYFDIKCSHRAFNDLNGTIITGSNIILSFASKRKSLPPVQNQNQTSNTQNVQTSNDKVKIQNNQPTKNASEYDDMEVDFES